MFASLRPGLAFALAVWIASCSEETTPPLVATDDVVSYESLLEELASLDALTAPRGERAWQLSSSNPDSNDPSELTLESWFANGDHGYFHGEVTRDGRRELVMAEVEGPGLITRIWSANPMGTIRIYIDDFAQPAIEVAMSTLLRGEDPRFAPPFAFVAGGGSTFQSPLPFAERVRVTTDMGEQSEEDGLYYHVGGRRFAPEVVVEPWSEARHDELAAIRAEVSAVMQEPALLERGERRSFELDANESLELNGPATIRALTFALAELDAATLRSAVLSISFDQVETVRVPLGDFFGHGPGLWAFETLPMTVAEDGSATSRFPMPFAQDATITIESDEAIHIQGELRVDEPLETPWRFFARWRDEGTTRSQPRRDLRIADIGERGAFVGLLYEIANGSMEWWGEGDERIYVDGEARPSWRGTGTEDYFGYAYCDQALFSTPTFAQTGSPHPDQPGRSCSPTPGHTGRISNVRFHVLDPIRFEQGLVFDFELWHWWYADLSIQTLSYWYGDPGASHDFPELSPGSEVTPVATLRGDERLEGEEPVP